MYEILEVHGVLKTAWVYFNRGHEMTMPRSRLARRSYDHVFCFAPSTPAGLEPHFLYSVCNGGLFSGVHQVLSPRTLSLFDIENTSVHRKGV